VGAVGGYYGSRLAVAGHPVRFLARSDATHLRRHGLLVESPNGDVFLEAPEVYDDAAVVPASDVVLIAVKATNNDGVARVLPQLVGGRSGRSSAVVLLQNGLGGEERLRPACARHPLVGALCFVCINKIGPGHIRHLDYGRVTLAPDTLAASGAVDAIAEDLMAAGVPVSVEAELAQARWKKLVWNVPFNGLSVVTGALPQELLADADGRSLVEHLMIEVQAGAAAVGSPIEDEFLARMVDDTVVMRPYLTSMKRDYDARRPLEIEAIFGNPIRAARAAGSELVRMAALYAELSILDRRNRRNRRTR
jgi:2-dehydropantoate 2-reductase